MLVIIFLRLNILGRIKGLTRIVCSEYSLQNNLVGIFPIAYQATNNHRLGQITTAYDADSDVAPRRRVDDCTRTLEAEFSGC